LGIDFGTSSTVAVVALPERDPRPLLFDGSPLLPSAVCVDPTGRVLVGRDALHTAMSRPDAFEPHPKRRVDDGTVLLGDAQVSVSGLYRAVLDRVVAEARHVTGRLADQPLEVVVTCPAVWGPRRRAILLDAAPAGARLVDEPVAAAHHFAAVAGADLPVGRTAVVYDLGAGTFDAAVVRRTVDGFAVVAAQGVDDCGGLDIDAAIVAHLAGAVPDVDAWRRLDQPVTATDRRARHQLWDNVRAGKEMLSRTSATLIHLPILDREVPLGREEVDALAAPILDRTVATVRAVLATAGVAATDVAAIFLAGGASRMPAVVTVLHRAFGMTPTTVDQPELAVAEGSLRALATGGPRPPAPPAPPPAPVARRRPGRLVVIAAATVALFAVGVTAILAADRDPPGRLAGSSDSPGPAASPTPSPSPSPSPTYPAGVDPCLLGVWRVTVNTVYGRIGDEDVQYTGGAGVTITYKTDNTYTFDYAKMKPRIAKYQGATYSDVTRGSATIRYFADGDTMIVSMVSNKATGELRRNGSVVNTEKSSFLLEPVEYRCTPGRLLLSSSQGGYTIDAVRAG